jgi:GNAT superfamily N-acetyltransferase
MDPADWQPVQPATPEAFDLYYDLRWRILRQPWGQPRGSERDSLEEESIHLMLLGPAGQPAAVGRLHFNSREEAQIRYMAVDLPFQRQGAGSQVLSSLEERAGSCGAERIVLNARLSAAAFYLKKGYRERGPAPALFGLIPHVRLEKWA